MTDYFTYKGYGRIYVPTQEDVNKVEQIIKDNDPDEFECYYPPGLVTTIDEYPRVVYIGKFEICFDLREECKKQNIPIFIFDAGMCDYPNGYYPSKPLTKEEILKLMKQ